MAETTTTGMKTYRTRAEAVEAGRGFAERENVSLFWEYHEGDPAKELAFGDSGSYTTEAYVEVYRRNRRYFPVLVSFDSYRQHGSLYRTESGGRIPEGSTTVGRLDSEGFRSYSGK